MFLVVKVLLWAKKCRIALSNAGLGVVVCWAVVSIISGLVNWSGNCRKINKAWNPTYRLSGRRKPGNE